MKGYLRVVRGNEVKLVLPGSSITQKPDGTLWVSGNPILGVDDPAEKMRIANLVHAHKYDQIQAVYFTRLGDNPNGLWAGTDDEWAKHPAKIEQDRKAAEEAAEEAKQVRIYLSSRGWGDFSACEWSGNITRPDTEILAECRNLLNAGYDIDQRNQSDDELLQKIADARAVYLAKHPLDSALRQATEETEIQRKIDNGFCFACESYCHGDCGHYSNDPQVKFRRDLAQAGREQNYGMED